MVHIFVTPVRQCQENLKPIRSKVVASRQQRVGASYNKAVTHALSYTTPYLTKMGGVPVVAVSVNGEKPMYFSLVSYVEGGIQIELWAAKELKLQAKEPGGVTAPLQSVYLTGGVKPLKLDFPDAELTPSGLPEEILQRSRVAGRIKRSFFERYIVRFEPVTRQITLYPKGAVPPHNANALTVPLLFRERNFPFPVKVSVNGKDKIFDLGEDSVVSSLPVGDDSLPALLLSSEVVVVGRQGKGKTTLSKALLPTLTIAGRVEPNVPLTVDNGVAGVLGLDFLRRFEVTMDVPNRTVTLVPAHDYSEVVRVPGVAGTSVLYRNGNFILGTVDPREPVFKAGGRPGDIITAIDGIEVKDQDQNEIEPMLNGKAMAKATVLLDRGGKSIPLTFIRVNPYHTQEQKGTLGVGLEFTGGGDPIENVVVSAVNPGGAADGSLQKGDEIVAVDGVTVKGIRAERFASLTTKRVGETITLTVRASGSETTREVKLVTRRALLTPQP